MEYMQSETCVRMCGVEAAEVPACVYLTVGNCGNRPVLCTGHLRPSSSPSIRGEKVHIRKYNYVETKTGYK